MPHAVEEDVYAGSALLFVLSTICGRLFDVTIGVCRALRTRSATLQCVGSVQMILSRRHQFPCTPMLSLFLLFN